MRPVTESGAVFICDNCNAVITGSAAAQKHYDECTINKDETENVLSSPESDEKELLIAEVFCREPLWNSQLPYAERSYNKTSIMWSEIDRILDVQNGYSQKTFKSLRDRFVKLLAEENKSKRSGSAANSKIDWKYFNQLNFLRPTVEFRPTISNLPKKRSIKDMETSISTSSTPKKAKSLTPAGSSTEDFESFCKKHLESNHVPDRIGSFMLYLESEIRTLPNQAVNKLIRKLTESLMQIQDESTT